MKIKMKRVEVEARLFALHLINNHAVETEVNGKMKRIRASFSIRFQYFLRRNMAILSSAQNAINKKVDGEILKAYHVARVEACEEFAEKKDGKPVISENGEYSIPEKVKPDFEKRIADCKTTHKAAFDEAEKYGQEEIEIDAYSVDYEKILDVEIPAGSFDSIAPFVNGGDFEVAES